MINALKVPHDGVLEATIIGSMFYEPNCIDEIVEVLKPAHFYHITHKRIYEKTIELWKEDDTKVNLQEIQPFLQKENIKFELLYKMVNSVASVRGIRYHAERLKDIAVLRAAVEIGGDLTNIAHLRDSKEIKETVSIFTNKLQSVQENLISTQTMQDIKSAMDDYDREFEKLKNSTGITGIPSGFIDLDNLTAGFQDEDLIILGARPSMGKTALMLQIAEYASLKKQESTAIFSIEMPKRQLIKRMIASHGKINLQKINRGILSESEERRFNSSRQELRKANLIIDDEPNLTVTDIRAKCRKIKREKGLRFVLIDYLGLIRPELNNQSRYEQVSDISRQLKNLARELRVPVIALSQLNRGVESRPDKRPLMADIRESGNIEQDADIVAFLYRDEYYKQTEENRFKAELIIAKHRNGATGTIHLKFFKETNLFVNGKA